MRIHYTLMAAVAALYAATAELHVLSERKVRWPDGECDRAPEDHSAIALAVYAVLIIAPPAWVARGARSRWMPSTALHAAVPAAVGTVAGTRYYEWRLPRAAECFSLEFCGGSCLLTTIWDSVWMEPAMAALAATVLGLAAGFIARRVRGSI